MGYTVFDSCAYDLLSHLSIYFNSAAVSCGSSTSPTMPLDASYSTNKKGLMYDPDADQFIFPLNAKQWAAGCYNAQAVMNSPTMWNSIVQIRLVNK